jgi:tRNA threonylcarbamoyl adenosine modification protein YeaZ
MPISPITFLGISCDTQGVEISAAVFDCHTLGEPSLFVSTRQEGQGSSSDAALTLVDEVLGNLSRSAGFDLGSSGPAPRDWLTGIAFNAGPGGFTAVRGACALAQGLGFGWGKAVAAISSLEAWAESLAYERASAIVPGRFEEVLVLLDARMGELYAGHFQATLGDSSEVQLKLLGEAVLAPGLVGIWIRSNRILHTSVSSVVLAESGRLDPSAKLAPAKAWFCGDFQVAAPSLLNELEQDGWCAPEFMDHERPRLPSKSLLRRAFRLRDQAFQSPSEVAPRYVRNKVALNSIEQQALRDQHRAALLPVRG